MKNERQYHIALAPGDISPYVLLPGDPGRVKMIAEFLDAPRQIAHNREFCTYRGEADGIPITVTSTGIGCPSAAIALEELIAIGAHTFIRVGTAGAIGAHIRPGDLTITTAAVRDEGTTPFYVPLSYPAVAHFEVVRCLLESAGNRGVRYHLGIGHCKDAFYAETPNLLPDRETAAAEWQIWRRAGVLSTSMEAAALFVIGSIRGVRVGEVLTNIGGTWEEGAVEEHTGIEEAIQVAIAALVRLVHLPAGNREGGNL